MAAEHPDALNEIRALVVKGDIDGAMKKIGVFLNDDFFNEEALFMLGACYMSCGLNGLAAVITSAAIDARAIRNMPYPEALLNLGCAYKAERDPRTAQRIWEDALKAETLPRERAKILTNIATLYINENKAEECIRWCERALAEDKDCIAARANRGMAHLELGHWSEGWDGYACAYDTGDRVRRQYGRQVRDWVGEPGHRVIVFGDQGIGDEIFFASCLPEIIEMSEHVIVDCHPRLETLLKRSFPKAEVHGTRKNLSDLEWLPDSKAESKVGMADLPAYFRNSKEAVLAHRGSFLVHEPAPARIRGGIPRRIGISWSGGTKKTRIDLRTASLDTLLPIFRAAPDAEFYSLQYTPSAAREVCEFEEKTGVRISHFPGCVECWDYDKTASFVESLDLVISVPTTVYHLSAGLGVPTWVMADNRCAWRERWSSTWYGAVRQFWHDGNWPAMAQEVAEALAGRIARPGEAFPWMDAPMRGAA